MDDIKKILTSESFPVTHRGGITVIKVKNQSQGFEITTKILNQVVSGKTVLFLSGGKTPKELYVILTEDGKLYPGGVALVDERYGPKLAENSNEKMIKDTGLYRFFELANIPFYPILHDGIDRVQTAVEYDQTLRSLFSTFPKSVAILGIGVDGHTAGIAGDRSGFTNPMFDLSQKNLLVSEFNDPQGMFRQRISMTFLGLSMIDILLVLVFGKEKKAALSLCFSDGSIEEVPSRFLKNPDMAKKTVLITDQEV